MKFHHRLVVYEYTRQLCGGQGVPGDGSLVSLGLGKQARQITAALPEDKPKKGPVEETAWVPSNDRVTLLKASMGAAAYIKAISRHTHDIAAIHERRQSTNSDEKDRALMPRSMDDARQRAIKVQCEVDEVRVALKLDDIKASLCNTPNVKRPKIRANALLDPIKSPLASADPFEPKKRKVTFAV